MASVDTYFGGAARFNSSHTFLGTKMQALKQAAEPASELTQVENVLGKSQNARYAAMRDQLAQAVPVVDGMAGTGDIRQYSEAIAAAKAKEAKAAEPGQFKMPRDIVDSLKSMRFTDAERRELLKQFADAQIMTPDGLSIPTTGPGSPMGKRIAAVANQFVGVSNYNYGNWDCSAFTQRVISQATGFNISRSTASQISFFREKRLFSTNIKDAQVGDVLYFRSGSSPSGRHTGIYIGNGMMIDNAGSGKPIKVRSIAGRALIGIGLATRLN